MWGPLFPACRPVEAYYSFTGRLESLPHGDDRRMGLK
jgi:hypothetical protein